MLVLERREIIEDPPPGASLTLIWTRFAAHQRLFHTVIMIVDDKALPALLVIRNKIPQQRSEKNIAPTSGHFTQIE